jgi:hypothetical protein
VVDESKLGRVVLAVKRADCGFVVVFACLEASYYCCAAAIELRARGFYNPDTFTSDRLGVT